MHVPNFQPAATKLLDGLEEQLPVMLQREVQEVHIAPYTDSIELTTSVRWPIVFACRWKSKRIESCDIKGPFVK